jgi:N-acetylglucosamine-6-phosphate deacetylase
MLSAHCQYGTTAFLPTLITDELSVMQQAAETISAAIQQSQPGILGVHFEGPHLSVPKKGVHSERLIRAVSPLEWQLFTRDDLGRVVVTLAPETVDIAAISTLLSAKVLVSIGHSHADFETAQAAVDIGVNGFTHLFNAMSGLQGRQPGVLGCALLNDQCYAGIILDGHHVDFASAKLAYKVKPVGKLFLVTDAMSTIGTEQTVFDFFDRQVKLEDGKLISSTGELAGSALTMIDAVKNAMKYLNLSAAEALRMASAFPAHYLGLADSYGYLRQGYYASFVVLTDDFQVQQTWIEGQPCFLRAK